MKTVLEAETAQKKVDTGKDFDHAHILSRIARDDPPSDKNLKTGNLNEVNVAKSIGEKRNESVKLWFMKYLKGMMMSSLMRNKYESSSECLII